MPQEITADTTRYMVLGYVAFFVIGVGYLVSIIARVGKMRRAQDAIRQEMEETEG